MKKNYKKNVIEKIMKKNPDLLKDLIMSLLKFSFIMIYAIHKTIVLIKNYLHYLKENNSECFFKEYNIILILKKN